ncbi:unnamed protein product [Mytilus coruscus]|uniref:C2H2-type domain-containing protein n=1 Tax=Mytilus coruscus TaxID=42192 RepID=A0A6J8EQ55_MYTCO|nr:unnamed protein product [Mytilus coruscus]
MVLLQCSKCPFRGNTKNTIQHFIIKHASDDRVPFVCKTCNFKTVSHAKWQRHLKDLKKHHVNKEHICMKSINPYVVIVGEDITEFESTCINDKIFIQEEEIEIVEVNIDPKDEQILELENKLVEMKSTHENQLKDLEEKHTFECLRFGNFIERLEKERQILKKK